MRRPPLTVLTVLPVLLTGCSALKPLPTVASVDLPRYMGDWYVIGAIPTRLERGAHNAVESYVLEPGGTLRTTFRFRAGSFTGPLKTLHPVGTVVPGSGQAVWRMQFLWPFKAEYRIAWLDPNYQAVIVARSRRDYVWIMARAPALPDPVYRQLAERVAAMGYRIDKLRRVPQRWPEEQ